MNAPVVPWIKTGAGTFVDLLYPVVCAYCEIPVERDETLCVHCREDATTIDAPFCTTCSQPFDGAIDGKFSCANCRDAQFAFDHAVARYRSRGLVRELIHRFKYEGHFYLRRTLYGLMREGLQDERMLAQPVDAFVPVPLHPRRLRHRGFNQSETLCRLLSAETSLPILPALLRVRFTETQTHFARDERKRNLHGAFAIHPRITVAGRRLVLVDDVFTTGSTVHECALVLRQAGAASVRVLTVARG